MSNLVLEKYRTINPINDIATTDAMLRVLVEIPNERQEDFWIRSGEVGNICLYRNDNYPGFVLEYAQGSRDDSVTTLYSDNGLFKSRQQVADMRKALIDEIGRVLLALPSTVVVYDGGRERESFLNELGTAQLFDVLALFTSTDRKVA